MKSYRGDLMKRATDRVDALFSRRALLKLGRGTYKKQQTIEGGGDSKGGAC